MVDIRAKGILFDMDGTLVNTVQCVEKWWRQLASEHNVDINELLHNVHGHPTFDVLCKWFPEPMHTRQHAQDFESGLMNDPDGVFAVPGAPELLRTLHDREWAIVTAATEVLALTRLQQAGIECPQYMVTDRSVQKGKPHPECYELGARMLGIEPRDAVVFEDSVNGAVAGHAAGATVIGVLTSTTEDKLRAAGAQYVVNDFSN
ncbi:DL-glycerol-3-phosphatase, partial [Coemansia sp. RSA 2618]